MPVKTKEALRKTRLAILARDPGYFNRKAREFRAKNPGYYKPGAPRLGKRKRRPDQTPQISEERYQELLAAQGGVCALCQRPPKAGWRRLRIDHDHTTGHMRGLLCGPCNSSLGHFGDSIDGLERAIAYLRRPPVEEVA